MTSTPNPLAANSRAHASDAATRFGSGQSVRRLEDDALLVGAGQFTSDVNADGHASIFFLRSPYAHARILSIDITEAGAMPGVLQIVTGADMVAAGVKPIPGSTFKRLDRQPCAAPARRALAPRRLVASRDVTLPSRSRHRAGLVDRRAAEPVLRGALRGGARAAHLCHRVPGRGARARERE